MQSEARRGGNATYSLFATSQVRGRRSSFAPCFFLLVFVRFASRTPAGIASSLLLRVRRALLRVVPLWDMNVSLCREELLFDSNGPVFTTSFACWFSLHDVSWNVPCSFC